MSQDGVAEVPATDGNEVSPPDSGKTTAAQGKGPTTIGATPIAGTYGDAERADCQRNEMSGESIAVWARGLCLQQRSIEALGIEDGSHWFSLVLDADGNASNNSLQGTTKKSS